MGAGHSVGAAIAEIEAALVPEPTSDDASPRTEPKAESTQKSPPAPEDDADRKKQAAE